MDDVILLLYSEIKVRVRTSDDALPSGKRGMRMDTMEVLTLLLVLFALLSYIDNHFNKKK